MLPGLVYTHFKEATYMKYTPEQIKSTLNNCISDMAKYAWLYVNNPASDFTRKRKISFEDTMKCIISMQRSPNSEELLEYYHYATDCPTQSAFIQQRAKIRHEAFQILHQEFMEKFSFEGTYKGYRLLACDGTRLNIAHNPEDTATFCNSAGGEYNQLHLNTLYDVGNNIYIDAVVQNLTEMDERRALCDMLDHFCENTDDKAIFIADRGYESLNVFAHAIENKTRFLIRAKTPASNTTLLSSLSLPDTKELDVDIERFLTRKNTENIRNQSEIYKRIDGRTFDYLDSKARTPYYITFRVVSFPISDTENEYIITNLPRYEFPPEEIKRLYHMRWGIETSYRELKHEVDLIYFHSQKPEFVKQEIFARLILYNFSQLIASQVIIEKKSTTKHEYKPNFSMVVRICIEFIRQLKDGPPMDVTGLIGKYLLPIRPDRKFPRCGESRPAKSFNYR